MSPWRSVHSAVIAQHTTIRQFVIDAVRAHLDRTTETTTMTGMISMSPDGVLVIGLVLGVLVGLVDSIAIRANKKDCHMTRQELAEQVNLAYDQILRRDP